MKEILDGTTATSTSLISFTADLTSHHLPIILKLVFKIMSKATKSYLNMAKKSLSWMKL